MAHPFRRYYYARGVLPDFERSLDVYPAASESVQTTSNNSTDWSPVVILVVGSAWLGYWPFVYRVTSWWNSSGPAAVVSSGYTCVCVRHRGSFPSAVAAAVAIAVAVAASFPVFAAIVAHVAILYASFRAGGTLASHDDMCADVADALLWIRNNPGAVGDRAPRRVVIGGYSSGAHVVATVLSRSVLFRERGLPPPFSGEWICAVLYVSGVLAVRPESLPEEEEGPGGAPIFPSSSYAVRRRWIADLILLLVFGGASKSVPSPLHVPLEQVPTVLPHILVGCRNETFGVALLDVFFCSNLYAERIRIALLIGGVSDSVGMVRYVELSGPNHWNVLASSQFQKALKDELRRLSRKL